MKRRRIALTLLAACLALQTAHAAWDKTKPATSTALVSADIRANWAALESAIGNPDTTPLTIKAANFVSSVSFSTLPTGVGASYYSRSTADFTKNNNTTLSDVTGCSFAIGANETWTFRFVLHGVTGTTADWKFAVTFPASPTGVRYGLLGQLSDSTYHKSTATAAAAVATQGMSVVEEMLVLEGLVRNGANAGTVQLQAAQNVAEATNTIIRAESFVVAQRMN